jgi:hypothetical protein
MFSTPTSIDPTATPTHSGRNSGPVGAVDIRAPEARIAPVIGAAGTAQTMANTGSARTKGARKGNVVKHKLR